MRFIIIFIALLSGCSSTVEQVSVGDVVMPSEGLVFFNNPNHKVNYKASLFVKCARSDGVGELIEVRGAFSNFWTLAKLPVGRCTLFSYKTDYFTLRMKSDEGLWFDVGSGVVNYPGDFFQKRIDGESIEFGLKDEQGAAYTLFSKAYPELSARLKFKFTGGCVKNCGMSKFKTEGI